MCTYLNWPRSSRCAQCLYPKRRVSPAVSRNSPLSPRSGSCGVTQHIVQAAAEQQQQQQPTSNLNNNRPASASPPPAVVVGSVGQSGGGSGGLTVEHLSTVMESKLEVESNKGSSSSGCNNNSTTDVATCKWHCAACTYENWPKAKCCVICGVPKGKSEATAAAEQQDAHQQLQKSPSNSVQQQQSSICGIR